MSAKWQTPDRIPRVRAPRRGSKPTVSIIVASREDRSRFSTLLGPLAARCKSAGVELIVAWSGYPAQLAALKRTIPGVRFVAAPPDAPTEQLRSLGLAEAGGDVVAITDDEGLSDEGRISMLLSLASDGDAAGEVGATPNDWASYLSRSGLFRPTGSDPLRVSMRTPADPIKAFFVAAKRYGFVAFCVDLWRRSRTRTA
jgi:hypothetical protein